MYTVLKVCQDARVVVMEIPVLNVKEIINWSEVIDVNFVEGDMIYALLGSIWMTIIGVRVGPVYKVKIIKNGYVKFKIFMILIIIFYVFLFFIILGCDDCENGS